MIGLAIAVLWFLIGVIVLGFVVWIALWVLHNVFSSLPAKLDQAVWGIFAILCLIYALTLLADGGRISFPRVGFISSAEAAQLPIDPLHLNRAAAAASPAAASPAAAPGAVVGGLITGGLVPKIISDMQTLDTVAGQVNPKDTTDPAPYNTYLPEAHLCIEQAVPWLQNLPTMASVPTPTGDGGLLTTIGMAEIQSDNLQAFLAALTTNGFPKNVKIPCAAWAGRVALTPSTLVGNAGKDVMGFIALFAH